MGLLDDLPPRLTPGYTGRIDVLISALDGDAAAELEALLREPRAGPAQIARKLAEVYPDAQIRETHIQHWRARRQIKTVR